MPIKDKNKKDQDPDDYKGNPTGTNNVFPIAMIVLVIIIAGGSFLAYFNPGIFEPIFNEISGFQDSNNSKHDVLLNNTNKLTNKNKDSESKPIKGYSELTIGGLKTYIRSEYTKFTEINDSTKYDGIEGYLNLTTNDSANFVNYKDFSKLSSKNGSFNIFVSNGSKVSKPLDRINSEYAAGNIANDTTIIHLGNNLRIIHYNKYSDDNFNGEMTFAYFKVDGKDVAIGWEGDKVDIYVIESFFKLNN